MPTNKVRHYKTLNNAFLRNPNEYIYSPQNGQKMTGNAWYASLYFSDSQRNAPVKLTLNEYNGEWTVEFE